ncbi:hypothetical protein ACHAWO_004034 [Cyclotella atomus]|uniref:Uncharacterized protein n=1 Tax=Cyclotella atomus TaxID=382360 RepID=A0ABD3MVK0_9STRA
MCLGMMTDAIPVKEERPGVGRTFRGKRGGKSNRSQPEVKASNYKAPTPGYEEYIYNVCAVKHAAQYIETTERLTNYIQSGYAFGADIAGALRSLTELVINLPDAPTPMKDVAGNDLPITDINTHIFKRNYDAAHKWKIKGLCCKFDTNKHPPRAMKDLSNRNFHEHFNSLVTSAESYGSSIGDCSALVDEELRLINPNKNRGNATNDELEQCTTRAKEKYVAMLMLDAANYRVFGELRKELDRD